MTTIDDGMLERDMEARRVLLLIDRALLLAGDPDLRERLEWSATLIRSELLLADDERAPAGRSTPRD